MYKTKHQLACDAAMEWDLVAKDAKTRQGGRHIRDGKGKTREILSKQFNVAYHYIQLAKRILDSDPELFEQIRNGDVPLPYPKPSKDGESLALYRAYDLQGELLYVGVTKDMGQRMRSHASFSGWWNEFSYMTVDRSFLNRLDLEQAETMTIKNESPKYNISKAL